MRRWWRDDRTYEEVVESYGPAIDGSEPTDHYVIRLGDREIGMIQTYLVSDYPEYEAILEVGPGVAGVDLFVGEEDLVHGGLGPQILGRFVRQVVFARPGTTACIAGPEVENTASIRAFEKAGFTRGRVYENTEDDTREQLLRIERPG